MMERRAFLAGSMALLPLAFIRCAAGAQNAPDQNTSRKQFEVTRSEEEWRNLLNREQFRVLRGHDTERPGSSALNDEHRSGTYRCAGCDLPLYSSTAKFESGTGWPSFTAPLDNAIGTSVDRSFFGERIEIHCRRCGGHLGHVFDDGPKPTGKRYCMNGVSMIFKAASPG